MSTRSSSSFPNIRGLQPLIPDWSGYEGKASAVVMLFFPPQEKDGPQEVLFIRRATGLRSHSGQVGFPGGRREQEDSSPLVTALRETEEEIGLPREQVTILGMLSPIHALDGHPVFPLVGTSKASRMDLTPQASEVASIFFVPWTHLTDASVQELSFKLFGVSRTSPLYPYGEDRIWGLTAKMVQNAGLTRP